MLQIVKFICRTARRMLEGEFLFEIKSLLRPRNSFELSDPSFYSNILPSYEAVSQMYRILVLEHSLQTSTCYVKKTVFFLSFSHWWLGKGMYSHVQWISQACTHNSWLNVNAVFSTAKFVKISFKFLHSYIILRLVSISGYKIQI